MTKHSIFYSWQSDLPNSSNRGFIEDCLQRAINEIRADEELTLDPCLDRDTSGVSGSPDIAATIFEKIKAAQIFVGDVSFINPSSSGRPTPNPNVLVELGYAAGRLGWDRIICILNTTTGSIDGLPFDVRQRRVRVYDLLKDQEKVDQRKALVSVLKADITNILHAPDKAEADALSQLLSALASELIAVLIVGDELDDRLINPWLDSVRCQFGATADTLRQLASTETAILHSMATDLNELAKVLDDAAHIRLNSSSWAEFHELTKSAVEKARAIKEARIDTVPLSEGSLAAVPGNIAILQRQLVGLEARAKEMAWSSRLDYLQSESAQIGSSLLQLGYHNIDAVQSGISQSLRRVGRELHSVETMQVYIDGGRSVEAILNCVRKCTEELTAIATKLGYR